MHSAKKSGPKVEGLRPQTGQQPPPPRALPVRMAVAPRVATPPQRQPVAPPVYRPQVNPRAVQPKTNGTQQVQPPPRKPPVAPPVYRPAQKMPVQAKSAPNAQEARQQPKPLPYRPQPKIFKPQQRPLQAAVQPKLPVQKASGNALKPDSSTKTGVVREPQVATRPVRPSNQHSRAASPFPTVQRATPKGLLPAARSPRGQAGSSPVNGPPAQNSMRWLPVRSAVLQARLKQARGGQGTQGLMRAVPTPVAGRAGVLQATWETDFSGVWKWDILVEGVQWYTDGNVYWYDPESHEAKATYSAMAGQRLTRQQWKGLGARDLPEEHIHYEAMLELAPSRDQLEENISEKSEKKIEMALSSSSSSVVDKKAELSTQSTLAMTSQSTATSTSSSSVVDKKAVLLARRQAMMSYKPTSSSSSSSLASSKKIPEKPKSEPKYVVWSSNVISTEIGKVASKTDVQKPFFQWLYNDGPEPKEMNCWEAVLFAAFKAGIKNKDYIKKAIIIKLGEPAFAIAIINNPAGQLGDGVHSIDVGDLANRVIPRGYVVIFGDSAHVALSTGKTTPVKYNNKAQKAGEPGHGILELDRATQGVSEGTVEDNASLNQYSRKLSWGPLPPL